jgi:hypothetical protein
MIERELILVAEKVAEKAAKKALRVKNRRNDRDLNRNDQDR